MAKNIQSSLHQYIERPVDVLIFSKVTIFSQVWYLIVSIPLLGPLNFGILFKLHLYFLIISINMMSYLTCNLTGKTV